MLGKTKIKFITSLREKKYRKINHCFTAEGSTLVLDFLNSNQRIIEIFATKHWFKNNSVKLNDVKKTEVTISELKKISNLKNPSQVLAIIETNSKKTIERLSANTWTLILDGIHDPGNMGTIIRTAEWFGISSIFCSYDTVDVFNPKVVQASMGSIVRTGIYYTDLKQLLTNKPANLTVFGTILKGNDIRKEKKHKSGAIIIGSEAHGISEELIPLIDKKVSILSAVSSKAESLNASVATAIACFALLS